MRYLLLRFKRLCGFIAGFVFFAGGILKLMDPSGAGLVMGEYLDFMHLKFLGFASKPLGTAFAFAETIIGTALITGVWRRISGTAALAFQFFFTILTLALVIFNPKMDCGCFGEAIHLTHMESFLKNIVLCMLLCLYLFPVKHLGTPKKQKYVSFFIVSASVATFALYSWMHIPLVDFTDYKPGAVLKAGNAFATQSEDIYDAVFVYQKDGTEEAFGLNNLPDSTWTFVRTETAEKPGSETEGLIDLSMRNEEGEYMDELASAGKAMIISVYNPDISASRWNQIEEFARNAQEAGFKSFILVPDMPEIQLEAPVYLSDYKTLIAMNRSNGGATYFCEGYLIRKWSFGNLPSLESLEEIHDEDETETVIEHDTKGSLGFQGFLLYVFAVMMLL